MQETRYITDENGERTGVILSIEEYERMVDALEDLEDADHIRAARETRARIERGEEETVPWEQARERIGSGEAFEEATDPESLARGQGVSSADFDELLGDFWPEEEGPEEFTAALGEWRREPARRAS